MLVKVEQARPQQRTSRMSAVNRERLIYLLVFLLLLLGLAGGLIAAFVINKF